MRITIKDVANKAGVSVSTVSRVLNGRNYVDKEKKETIMSAISELNYVPNALAQNLGSQKAGTIGVLALRGSQQAFSNPYFSEVIRGISSVMEKENVQILLNNFESMEQEIENCIRLAKSGRVDGFILLSSRIHDDLIVELMKNEIDFVLIGRVIENTIPNHEEVYYINTDNIKSSVEAVSHLIEKGAAKIGIITAPGKFVVSEDRYLGYRQALMMHGLKFEERFCVNGGYTVKDAKMAVNKLLDQSPDIDSIFATDDMKAAVAIHEINERGLSVPDDILVIGHGDFEIAELVKPRLSTIRVPVFELGEQAAKVLLQIMDKNFPEEKGCMIDTKLIIRGSTRKEVK